MILVSVFFGAIGLFYFVYGLLTANVGYCMLAIGVFYYTMGVT